MRLKRLYLICAIAVLIFSHSMADNSVDQKTVKAFMDYCGKKAETAETMTVTGRDGWLFLKNELRHISVGEFWGEASAAVSGAARPDKRDPLSAIVHYKAELDRLGIELILVPVPPKAVIYPDKISDSVKVEEGEQPPRLDVHHQEFYRILREKGIMVIDPAAELMPHRFDKQGAMYCKTDTHWSGIGCVRIAGLLAKELKDRPWMKHVEKIQFGFENKSIIIEGDLLRGLRGDNRPAPETLSLRFVGTKTGSGIEPIEPDPASPVLLMADSHGLVFHSGSEMYAKGAGLADQLAFELGFAVDLIAKRGSGVTPARIDLYRRGRKDANYLAAKKVIIWCFSAREFTGSGGWSKVPVVKREVK